ncbi:hypothetical protein [Nocardioides sp. Root151]|uniref:hypothetical protein n=1 Tax=Nocardioides sp. Root151 TaxID=1736475 RepID=UPI000AD67F3E|nr:hypothetical protein [Nocardioides sp. Root151]
MTEPTPAQPPPTGPPPRKRRRTVLMTAGLTASASVIAAATVFGAQAETAGADDADSTSQTPWYGDPFLEDD